MLARVRRVGGSHKKTAFSLKQNVGALIGKAGISNIVFFTPTFPNKNGMPPTPEEAQAAWRKMELALVKEFPGGGIRILERGGKTQRLHYHVLADVGCDVRTGYDFKASRRIQEANPRAKWHLHGSANANLRRVHDVLYRMAQRAGFGTIFHCEPAKDEAEALKCYLSKYIIKHIGQRLVQDKGVRLLAYFGEASDVRAVPSANGFAFGGSLTEKGPDGIIRPCFQSGWGWLMRTCLKLWMRSMRIGDMDEARELFGPKWYFKNKEAIWAKRLEIEQFPHAYLAKFAGLINWGDLAGNGAPDLFLQLMPLDARATHAVRAGIQLSVTDSENGYASTYHSATSGVWKDGHLLQMAEEEAKQLILSRAGTWSLPEKVEEDSIVCVWTDQTGRDRIERIETVNDCLELIS
jgi:hypothetical protein